MQVALMGKCYYFYFGLVFRHFYSPLTHNVWLLLLVFFNVELSKMREFILPGILPNPLSV